ncbi:Mce family protein [Gordonia hirsuta DSM 44140 = NBRC 16056]|uniref:Mce family protein n=1 Tax=Gordonia hirsuta DSM 44140 = NBRC 16056 TaxID=1121927 RepID=L7L8J5_9ACTN|nr:MCE family protein [Gordonia hirsuta]GAC56353.1 Mce family protein [Gordonia hirsuta DSM 44140 = NBRC 16056]
MIRYERKNTLRTGVIGLLVIALVAAAATSISSLPLLASKRVYIAEVADAAGLRVGDDVVQHGVVVGRVSALALAGDHVDVTLRVDGAARLADQTSARISTATVLGTRQVILTSAGTGTLAAGAVIPRTRTQVPYDLTTALGDLTEAAADLDTDQMVAALAAVDDVLSGTPDQLRDAVAGVGALSETIAQRDTQLRSLLARADQVSGVLAQRSAAVNALIGDADVILGELVSRRRTVETLMANVTLLSQSLGKVVADNRATLAPTLDSVNSVLEILSRQRTDIGQAISSLAPYVTELGEAVASGPFFSSYIANLLPGQIIEPFLRQAMAAEGIPYPAKGGRR